MMVFVKLLPIYQLLFFTPQCVVESEKGHSTATPHLRQDISKKVFQEQKFPLMRVLDMMEARTSKPL